MAPGRGQRMSTVEREQSTARHAAPLASLAATVLLGACAANIPPDAGKNPADPFERFNRRMFEANKHFDEAVLQPVARAYNWALPKVLRDCVSNMFDNLGEVGNLFNASLQGKANEAVSDTGRLLVNSTVGLAGCFDVARQVGLERKRQNFGYTLASWGLTPGPYLVLPLLGPSTVRQTVGLVPDYFLTDPVGYVRPIKDEYAVDAVRLVDTRAQLIAATKVIEAAAIDSYTFIRDGYLQRLRSQTEEGRAPPPPVEEDPDAPEPMTEQPAPAPKGEAPAPAAPAPEKL